jgi:hypothetical protein
MEENEEEGGGQGRGRALPSSQPGFKSAHQHPSIHPPPYSPCTVDLPMKTRMCCLILRRMLRHSVPGAAVPSQVELQPWGYTTTDNRHQRAKGCRQAFDVVRRSGVQASAPSSPSSPSSLSLPCFANPLNPGPNPPPCPHAPCTGLGRTPSRLQGRGTGGCGTGPCRYSP